MQTLRAGCSKAEPKIFAPSPTPFPGARDGQNLISWRWSLPLPTSPVWRRSMHAISSYRGNRPPHTHPQIGAITIHCAAASAQCNNGSLSYNANVFERAKITRWSRKNNFAVFKKCCCWENGTFSAHCFFAAPVRYVISSISHSDQLTLSTCEGLTY